MKEITVENLFRSARKVAGLVLMGSANRPWLFLEFVGIFLFAPLLVVAEILPNRPIPVLLTAASLMVIWLWIDGEYDLRQLVNPDGIRDGLRHVLIRFLLLASILAIVVLIFVPEMLFVLIKNSPITWAIVMIGYPVFSVYPQEIIFRAFIFQRYRRIFGEDLAAAAMSAMAFAFVHIVFGSWVSVALSFWGGILFAITYARTRSLLLAAIEHALYGQFIFTIGLGPYFYHGTMH